MATNNPTIQALEAILQIIQDLPEKDSIELKLWGLVLKEHIREQKNQDGQFPNHHYELNIEKRQVRRIGGNGKLISKHELI